MTKGIRIASNLTLDLDIVVEATAVVGKRGRGKTFTSKRIVEETHRNSVTFVVIDPTDVWYGLASGSDGSGKGGLDGVVIIGGKHGDVPLREGSGPVLARAILAGTSMVVVTKGLPKAARRRLVGELLTELYDHADGTPILVVIDEADEYAPQGSTSAYGNKRDDPLVLCSGAVEDIVRRGRAGGLGSLLITQRVAVLSKNVLEQSDTLVALGVTGKNDIDAVAGWIAKHAPDVETGKKIVASLPGLAKGHAWVWSPEYGVLECVEVLPITTYDSSRSPKVGEIVAAPKARKPIDLAALGEEMQRFAEEVKADDPKELRKQLANLRQRIDLARGALVDTGYFTADQVTDDVAPRIVELWSEFSERPAVVPDPVIINVPVLDEATLARVDALVGALAGIAKQTGDVGDEIRAAISHADLALSGARAAGNRPRPVAERQPPRSPAKRADPPSRREPDRPAVPRTPPPDDGDFRLSDSQGKLLDALAWFESVRILAPTRGQVAFQSDVSPKSSGFEKNCSTLRTRGLIHFPGSNRLGLTDSGRAVANPPSTPATSEGLQEAIKSRLSESQRTILTVLIDIYPAELTRAELADRCQVSAQSSGFEKNLSTLRTLGLVDYPATGSVAATELLWID